ncbi:ribosome-inactivating family protein [Streptomyces sp. SS8]
MSAPKGITRFWIRAVAGITTLMLSTSWIHPGSAVAATEAPARVAMRTTSVEQSDPALDFALEVQRLIFRMRANFADSDPTPVGPHGFTHMLIGRGGVGNRNWGFVGVGHLNGADADDVELVVDPEDLYIRGFYRRSNNTLYHFRGAGVPPGLIRSAHNRVELGFPETYRRLETITVDRSGIQAAVDNLLHNTDTGRGSALQGALEIMAVTLAETARNGIVNREVYNALRQDGAWQVGAHAEVINSWNHMGGDIRAALADGDWDRERGQYVLDGQHGGLRRAYPAAFLLGVVHLIKRQ